MKQVTVLILLISALFSSCNPASDLNEDDVYTILNEIITDDSVQFSMPLCAIFKKPPLNNKVQNSFTDDDIKFIYRQIERLSRMKIQPNKIKRAGWRVLEKRNISPFAKIILTESDSILHSYFSFPIISSDRKKVILEIGNRGVFMGGGHGTYLFVKENNRWVLKDSWDIVIS